MRHLPALMNSTTVDWFHPWPMDALLSVSKKFLADLNLDIDKSGEVDEDEQRTHEAIIQFMPFAFRNLETVSIEFCQRRGGLQVFTTPKSYP